MFCASSKVFEVEVQNRLFLEIEIIPLGEFALWKDVVNAELSEFIDGWLIQNKRDKISYFPFAVINLIFEVSNACSFQSLRDSSILSGSLSYRSAISRLEHALYVDFAEHWQLWLCTQAPIGKPRSPRTPPIDIDVKYVHPAFIVLSITRSSHSSACIYCVSNCKCTLKFNSVVLVPAVILCAISSFPQSFISSDPLRYRVWAWWWFAVVCLLSISNNTTILIHRVYRIWINLPYSLSIHYCWCTV